MDVPTTTLNNGVRVLAHTDRHGYFGAMTFVNKAQAEKKRLQLQTQGIAASVYQPRQGPVRYLII